MYQHCDFPTYLGYCDFWVEHPPVFMLGALIVSAFGGKSDASTGQRPTPSGKASNNMGKFIQEFAQSTGAQGVIRRVPSDYYDKFIQNLGLPPQPLPS